MPDTALSPFATFVAEAATRSFPDTVWHGAKRALLDYMGATLPGGVLAPATLLKDGFADMLGRGRARIYPGGEVADPRTAALINGAASHTIEFDDIFREGIYHPGVPVISAALAIGQARGVSGETLMRGIVSGYEVSGRIAAQINPAHYAYWHTTGTVGTIGAAAAAATVLGLDAEKARHALANATTLAAGLQQAFRGGSMSKPMHGGNAADTGLMCAIAAGAGVTAVVDMLEGERGFGNAMCGGVDWSDAAETLGEEFWITRVTVKNHSACGHAHAAIDAAMQLQADHGFAANDVERVDAGTYATAIEIVGAQEITTAFEAKFSLPYCVAAALTIGGCRTRAFEPDKLADPDIAALARKVFVGLDEECQSTFPKTRSAKVTITLTDGRTVSHHAKTRKGDPDKPLSDAELSAKYRDLADDIIGAEQARLLEETIWSLETLADVGEIHPPLRTAAE